jgi:hypothetical protein
LGLGHIFGPNQKIIEASHQHDYEKDWELKLSESQTRQNINNFATYLLRG